MQANIYGKEEGILGEAQYHIRRPMPSITAGASLTPQHGGWWGPMGAASHRTSDLQSGQIKSLILEAAQSLGR
jgi:hypothetical protein